MFFTLLKYEFKKLFKKKSVWITVIFSALCIPISIGLSLTLYSTTMVTVEPAHKILVRLWAILPSQIIFDDCAFSTGLFKFLGNYFFAYQAAPVIYIAVSAALLSAGYMHYKRYQAK